MYSKKYPKLIFQYSQNSGAFKIKKIAYKKVWEIQSRSIQGIQT